MALKDCRNLAGMTPPTYTRPANLDTMQVVVVVVTTPPPNTVALKDTTERRRRSGTMARLPCQGSREASLM